MLRRLISTLALGAVTATVGMTGGAVAQEPQAGATGLPLPRFVSLKSDRVNLRKGPGTDYPTVWVFRRAGLPLEVVKEFESWRQVRDAEGATGWILQTMLSSRRTALVMPWDVKPDRPAPIVELKADDSAGSPVVASIEAGVIANIRSCDGRWCLVTIGDFRGYLEQAKLWGVYPGEPLR